MAMREIRLALSVADPTGKHPDPDEVVKALAVDVSPYQVYGSESTGNAVGIRNISLSCDGFVRETERWRQETDWEAFEKAIEEALLNFAR